MSTAQNATDALAALAEITCDELDRRGEAGETILLQPYIFDSKIKLPKLQGGWAAAYCGRFMEGIEGAIYLVPIHKWTRTLWEKGQIKNGVKAGLSEQHAIAWINSKIRYKHRLLERLVELINDADKRVGYSHYNRNFTNDEYQQWSARSGISDKLSPVLRSNLIRLYVEVTGLPLVPERED